MQAIFRIHSPPHTHTFRLKTAVEDFIRKEQKDRKVKRKRGNDWKGPGAETNAGHYGKLSSSGTCNARSTRWATNYLKL